MQEDMPLTFQDMQRTSKEFEILGKQLNFLTGAVVSTRARAGGDRAQAGLATEARVDSAKACGA